MSTPQDLVDRLHRAPRCTVRGEYYRHTHPKARLDEPPPRVLQADRWQQPGDESVLFMSDSEATIWAEWTRKVASIDADVTVEAVRNVGCLALSTDNAVNLTDPDVLQILGITDADLNGDDTSVPHAVLAAARHLRIDVLVAPSAARAGGTTVIVLPPAIVRVEVRFEERRAPP